MNLFRAGTRDGSLDRRYLRVCAVYRLLMRRRVIGKARAVELLQARSVPHAKGLVELWLAWPPTPRDSKRALQGNLFCG